MLSEYVKYFTFYFPVENENTHRKLKSLLEDDNVKIMFLVVFVSLSVFFLRK